MGEAVRERLRGISHTAEVDADWVQTVLLLDVPLAQGATAEFAVGMHDQPLPSGLKSPGTGRSSLPRWHSSVRLRMSTSSALRPPLRKWAELFDLQGASPGPG
jgi:hypothetical protein